MGKIWKKNISKHENSMKTLSTKKIHELYQSAEFKEIAKKNDETVLCKRKAEEVQSELNRIKDMYEIHGKDEEALVAKENLVIRSTFKILLVDDNEDILDLLKQIVSKKFPNVDCATSPYEAINMCQYRSYDLILSDFEMPQMNGYKFYKALKELEYKGEFMLCSGYNINQADNLAQAGVKCVPKGSAKMGETIVSYITGLYVQKLDKLIKAISKE